MTLLINSWLEILTNYANKVLCDGESRLVYISSTEFMTFNFEMDWAFLPIGSIEPSTFDTKDRYVWAKI